MMKENQKKGKNDDFPHLPPPTEKCRLFYEGMEEKKLNSGMEELVVGPNQRRTCQVMMSLWKRSAKETKGNKNNRCGRSELCRIKQTCHTPGQ